MNVYSITVGNNYDNCSVTAKSFEDAYQKAQKFLAPINKDREGEDMSSLDITSIELDCEITRI